MRPPSVLEISVSSVMSAIVALMVAYGGAAVEAATRAPVPGDRIVPYAEYSEQNTPDGKLIFGAPTPAPDPMTWCRPLNGYTVCIKEGT